MAEREHDGRPAVLVTGASGFIGRALVRRLSSDGGRVVAAGRLAPDLDLPGVACLGHGPLDAGTDWAPLLQGVGAVVHLAAWVHGPPRPSPSEAEACFRVNVEGTLSLARAARAAGVERFVFLSSMGARLAESGARPATPYQQSKLAAERALVEAGGTIPPALVFRPPGVYGPGAPGSVGLLAAAVRRGLPLPFASLTAERSFLYRNNLTDLLARVLDHPAAFGPTSVRNPLEPADGPAVTPPELVRALARAFGVPARLFPCPPALLALAGRLAGKSEELAPLLESLVADTETLADRLGWRAPEPLEAGLAALARGTEA